MLLFAFGCMFFFFKCSAEGQVIQVLSIGHGSADDIDCSDRTTPRELKDDQCLNEKMQGWIKFMWELFSPLVIAGARQKLTLTDYMEQQGFSWQIQKDQM